MNPIHRLQWFCWLLQSVLGLLFAILIFFYALYSLIFNFESNLSLIVFLLALISSVGCGYYFYNKFKFTYYWKKSDIEFEFF
jgi:divalent metal cation (Fe/Co/Zn/Cd) transporter